MGMHEMRLVSGISLTRDECRPILTQFNNLLRRVHGDAVQSRVAMNGKQIYALPQYLEAIAIDLDNVEYAALCVRSYRQLSCDWRTGVINNRMVILSNPMIEVANGNLQVIVPIKRCR